MAYTPSLHLYLPAPGEQGYGEHLNENFETLDSAVADLQQSTNPNAYVPTGCMIVAPTATPTAGWLLCDGSEVSRTEYAALFAIIGTLYGPPNDPTKFVLPNKLGRVVVGADPTGNNQDYALGATGGAESVTLTDAQMPVHSHGGKVGENGAHTHTGTANSNGAHTHSIQSTSYGSYETGYINASGYNPNAQTGSAGAHTHQLTINGVTNHDHTIAANGGGGAHENRMPYIAEYWWIKT